MTRLQHQLFFPLTVIGFFLVALGCEPPRPSRFPPPPSSNPTPAPRAAQPSAPIPPPLPPPDVGQKALPREARIREQDLRGKAAPLPSSPSKEPNRKPTFSEGRTAPETVPPPLPDDSSLLAKITSGVTPQRAASLRLTEEGRKLLDAGEPAKALSRLEKTIVIDSTNAYGYFYLAKTQYRLGRYKESLNFLDIAESRLGGEPFWLAEIHALRGENYRALGQMQKAEASYMQAIHLNSGNRTAADALSRMQADIQPISK